MLGNNYEMYYPESYSGTGTFEHHNTSNCSDDDLEDTIRIREISFMSLYHGDDSIPVEEDGLDEFSQFRKSNNFYSIDPFTDTSASKNLFSVLLDHTMNNEEDKVNELQLAQDEYVTNRQLFRREQRKPVLQSTQDRNKFQKDGDEPCTSGASLTSSEIRHDSDRNTNSEYRDINSVVNLPATVPTLTSKVQYVWYAAYDSEMADDTFADLLMRCDIKSKPFNKISIKLNDYDVVFSSIHGDRSVIYIQQRLSSSCFVKLYLIHKEQLLDLAILKNKSLTSNYIHYKTLCPSIVEETRSEIIEKNAPYNLLYHV